MFTTRSKNLKEKNEVTGSNPEVSGSSLYLVISYNIEIIRINR